MSVINAITFSAGIYIVLAGVRMLIAEIIPAFKGISEKLVPNAKPALDCPILFPYAPNAVLIGFFCSFIGGIVGLGVLALLGNTGLAVAIILPGAVVHFFCGASAGVCGNATGGLKGCIVGSFIHGIVVTFLAAGLLPVLGSFGFANTTFSDADFTIVGIIFGNLAKVLNTTTMFVMEMNVKKALENLGITDVEVEHSTIDDVMPGAADLFVCGADLLPNALSAGKAIGLENMVSMSEMESKLKEAFGL